MRRSRTVVAGAGGLPFPASNAAAASPARMRHWVRRLTAVLLVAAMAGCGVPRATPMGPRPTETPASGDVVIEPTASPGPAGRESPPSVPPSATPSPAPTASPAHSPVASPAPTNASPAPASAPPATAAPPRIVAERRVSANTKSPRLPVRQGVRAVRGDAPDRPP